MSDAPQKWVRMDDIFAVEIAQTRAIKEQLQPKEIRTSSVQQRGTEGDSPLLSPSVPPKTIKLAPTAPIKDYNKRANSLELDALPSGLFPGTSKKIYDALYVRTRGAIQPTRTICATKKEVAEWSGVKNRKTLDSHIRYLTGCNLLKRVWALGDNLGYTYEVQLPEEVGVNTDELSEQSPPSVPLSPSDQKRDRGTDQKRDRGTDQKRDRGGQSQPPLESATYEFPKTVKTIKTIDDEEIAIFGELNKVLAEAVRNITGKQPVAADAERWRQVGEELTAELRRAASNTESITSLPAFLLTHLQRRFKQKPFSPVRDAKLQAQRTDVDKLPQDSAQTDKHLSPSETDERVALFLDLLQNGGYTVEGLTSQFSEGALPEDWRIIMARVEERLREVSDALQSS